MLAVLGSSYGTALHNVGCETVAGRGTLGTQLHLTTFFNASVLRFASAEVCAVTVADPWNCGDLAVLSTLVFVIAIVLVFFRLFAVTRRQAPGPALCLGVLYEGLDKGTWEGVVDVKRDNIRVSRVFGPRRAWRSRQRSFRGTRRVPSYLQLLARERTKTFAETCMVKSWMKGSALVVVDIRNVVEVSHIVGSALRQNKVSRGIPQVRITLNIARVAGIEIRYELRRVFLVKSTLEHSVV